MYKQEIQEVENEIRYLSTHNGNTITINALKNALNELIALQEQYEAKLAKKEQQTKQEQEKERQEALKQAQLEKAQAKLNALLAQCSTPPPSTDLVAIKRVLESLNNLQAKLLSI